MLSVLLVNMRGFKSKKQSLIKVMKKVKPSVVVINETQLRGKMKAELLPYGCWSRNRVEQGGGGIATAVSPALRNSAMGAGEGDGGDEFQVTRIEKYKPAVNIINCYGEQRNTKVEEVEEKWRRLVKVMEDVRARGEFCLLAGDQNKLVGCDELGVPGNDSTVSPGGRLLRGLLESQDWVLVNSMGEEVVEGGPFTREDPATGKESCLDLFVASRELRPYITNLTIDKERKMAVYRVIKTKKSYKKVFSDHYSCLLTMKNLPCQPAGSKTKMVKWNLKKDNGWESYKKISDELSHKIEKIVENNELTVQEMTNRVEKVHNKIKYMAFGKVTIGNKKEQNNEDKTDEEKEETLKEIVEKQIEAAEAEITEIEKEHKCKAGRIWEIRKRALGGKKSIDLNAIENPKTGNLAMTKNEIKNITLQYCKETLTQNKPEPEYKETIDQKKKKIENMMKESDGQFKPQYQTFQENISKFRKGGKRNYDFLTKGGEKFQKSMFKVCERMFEKEEFPDQIHETTLHMIYKGKGKREVLSNSRFIHCKDWLARAAEGLVVKDGLKPCLLAGSSKYQVGGQPGHRPEELLFVMKSLVAKYRQNKQKVILQSYDVSKFFDKERMEDGILACQKRGADPKATRLWYKMNEKTKIKVKTAAGETETEDVGAVIGQGTIGGALISQAVLDEGVTNHFPPAGRLQLEYGAVPQAPLLWMDDVLNPARGLEEARESCKRMNTVMKERGLNLNQGKTVCIVIGSKKQKEDTTKDLKEKPMMCGDFEMKEKQVEKWLGQQISSQGLEDSVWRTIEAREGKIKAAAMEIAAVVNDWRCRGAGGLDSASMLWEACCIPSILHGAGTWVEMGPRSTRRLNKLQNWFLRLVLQVGPGTPLPALLWDQGMLDMEMRVWREKLVLAHHITGMDEESLARQMYEEQLAQQWPGLAREVEEICDKLGIQNVNSCRLDAKEFRKVVTSACHAENEKRLRKQSENIKKCKSIKNEGYGKQEYIVKEKLYIGRKIFKARYGMTDFAGNFKNNLKFKKTGWLCICKEEIEHENHLLSGKCKVYGDINEKYKTKDDKSLMTFFEEVLTKRLELEEQVEMPGGGATNTMIELATPAVASQLGGRNTQLAVNL